MIREEINNIPGPSNSESKINFSYYELEFLWAQNGIENKDLTLIFFNLEDYDVVFTLEEFLEYQREIFNLSLRHGAQLKEICFPTIEQVDVEEETLYFCTDLKNNIRLL